MERNPVSEFLPATAERALSETFGGSVRLGAGKALDGRSNVLRCPVVAAPDGVASSVVIKCAHRTEDHPYNPEDKHPHTSAGRFFNEWAGAQFLSGLAGDAPPGPRFYAGDRTLGFIVLEDLGEGQSLADLLLGENAARAEAGLLAFASTLGRMHALTIGRAEEYERLRDALGKSTLTPQAAYADHFRECLEQFHQGCRGLGTEPVAGFDAECEAAVTSVQAAGPFLAYTHGDPCPDNNRYLDGDLRLIDFEAGSFRHALWDGVYGQVPFPTCWCVNRLPAHLPPQMEAAYRAELSKGCPQAEDDRLFQRAVVEACACWLILTTGRYLLDEEDGQWGIATMRQRVLLRLDNFAARTEQYGYLEAMGATSRQIATRLRVLWPPEADQMPLYPAFQSGNAL
jgi:hypothetical protein